LLREAQVDCVLFCGHEQIAATPRPLPNNTIGRSTNSRSKLRKQAEENDDEKGRGSLPDTSQESGLGNFVWTMALTAFALKLGSPLLLGLVVVSVMSSFVAYKGVVALRRRLQPPQIQPPEDALKVPRRGVIFTLGPRSANRASVVHQVIDALRGIEGGVKPEFLGFLGTPQTDQAGIVELLCDDLTIPPVNVKSETCEPTDVFEGKAKAALIIEWIFRQGLNERDIVLDLTGGKATMSVAAFIAADEKRIDSQYIDSQYDSEKNQIKPGSQKQILITRYLPRPEG
jgi:hypothetical protein